MRCSAPRRHNPPLGCRGLTKQALREVGHSRSRDFDLASTFFVNRCHNGGMTQAAENNQDVWLVIPFLNERKVIADVIKDARRTFPNIVCVDDGSSDDSAAVARAAGATVVSHPDRKSVV